MAALKRALGIAAASFAALVGCATEARAQSSITFIGSSLGLDFGSFESSSFFAVPAATCPAAQTGICSSGGTGIFAGYNGFHIGSESRFYVGMNSGAVTGGSTPVFYAKPVVANIGNFNVSGNLLPDIAVDPATPTFAGFGITLFDTNYWARSFEGVAPVTVTGNFGTRNGTVAFKPMFGAFSAATGGNPTAFPEFTTITLTVEDPAGSQVPAPLPILGAGAAYGFSRKLRKRVALSTK